MMQSRYQFNENKCHRRRVEKKAQVIQSFFKFNLSIFNLANVIKHLVSSLTGYLFNCRPYRFLVVLSLTFRLV